MPELRRSNVEVLERGLDMSSLPASFTDAINFTIRLKTRYLWIDSLCIMQDDEADWEREVTLMGDVYKNACLYLAGLAAAERSVGLYVEREPHSALLLQIPVIAETFNLGIMHIHICSRIT